MRNATDSLRNHGAGETPRLDAEVMLCKVAGINRTELFTHPESLLSNSEVDRLSSMLCKRLAGVPVAYIIGRREFWSLELEVNEHVLIPRPDTETLVSAALDHLPENSADTILELGTGSGAIAIALAGECENPIIATDISEQALSVARRNAERHVPARIEFLRSDWLSALTSRVSMVVSNPPYLADDDDHLPDLQYEPRDALVAADNGFQAIDTIICGAANILTPGGVVLLEHGMGQGPAVRELFSHRGYTCIRTLKDLAGLERVTLGYYSGLLQFASG